MKRGVAFVLILILSSVFSLNTYLQINEKIKLEEKRSKIEKEIKITNALIEETRASKKNSLIELRLLKSNIVKRNELISELAFEIEKINITISFNSKKIVVLQAELNKVKAEYAALIYYSFKNSDAQLNYMYLLASQSVMQLYSRYKYLQQYKDYRLKQINLIAALNMQIEENNAELSRKREEKLTMMSKIKRERGTLLKESVKKDQIVEVLRKRESVLLSELEKKKDIAKKLEREIEDIIKREAKKRKFAALNADEKILSSEFVKNRSKLPWPCDNGIVIGKFGEHEHPVMKEIKVRNNGIDISTNKSALVRVVFDGVVSKVFTIKGAKSTIIVQHGNYFSVYHNIVDVCIKAGDKLKTKTAIGRVFTDQKSGESILHFELWKELEKLDPELWLSN